MRGKYKGLWTGLENRPNRSRDRSKPDSRTDQAGLENRPSRTRDRIGANRTREQTKPDLRSEQEGQEGRRAGGQEPSPVSVVVDRRRRPSPSLSVAENRQYAHLRIHLNLLSVNEQPHLARPFLLPSCSMRQTHCVRIPALWCGKILRNFPESVVSGYS